MNLCLVTSSFPLSPDDIAAPFVPPLIGDLEDLGHRVHVVTPSKTGAPTGWDESQRVFWFPWFESPKRAVNLSPSSPGDILRMLSLVQNGERALLRVIREKHIQACLGLWVVPGGYLAWQAKKRSGVPFGVWALGSDVNTWANYPIIGRIIRATLENADAVFADGFELARKTQVLARRDCLFLSSMRPMNYDNARSVQIGIQPVHFLFVGRWERVKGVDILLEAAQIAAGRLGNDKFEVVIVGAGEMEPAMREFVSIHNLHENVRLVVRPPFDQLLGYYKQSSCVVIPSRMESIPLVFGEALQAHKPMIVSEVGDMGELARRYQVARVVPPNNAEALAGALYDFILQGNPNFQGNGALPELLDLKTSARELSMQLGKLLTTARS